MSEEDKPGYPWPWDYSFNGLCGDLVVVYGRQKRGDQRRKRRREMIDWEEVKEDIELLTKRKIDYLKEIGAPMSMEKRAVVNTELEKQANQKLEEQDAQRKEEEENRASRRLYDGGSEKARGSKSTSSGNSG